MSDILLQLTLFSAKSFIVLMFIIILLIVFFMLLAKGKEKTKGRFVIKNLNDKYAETSESLLAETLPKKEFKQFLKDKKEHEKKKLKNIKNIKNIFVLTFNGDIKASTVPALSEEITAVLNIAKPKDEVVLRLESPGGVVHGYGLAAAQLLRLRDKNIFLTVMIDKIAASGGYLMACVANKIYAAPFAIVGSIGVIVQLPNFHRLLKDKHIDFEQQTAGEYKRTITLFGENTEEGREKLQQEINEIHDSFKELIVAHRPQLNIKKVATGEHWLGQQALELKLVDEIKTSDDYLLERSKDSHVYELCYETKKTFLSKLGMSAQAAREKLLGF